MDSELEKLREENKRLREENEQLRPLANEYVRRLELDFENSNDDGGYYRDWQDAKKLLEGIIEP